MDGEVQRFACTQCGACCNRSPEVELSEAAALSDVFVFRLMFRPYELPRTLTGYRACGKTGSSETFYQRKRLLGAFAAHKTSKKIRHGGEVIECDQYLTISALTLDTGAGACSALSSGRCSIYERRPFACRTVPFHYSQGEASGETDLKAFLRTPGYRCDTGITVPVVLSAGRIVDAETLRARFDALALAERDRPWHQAIVRRMKNGHSSLPTLRQIETDAVIGATTISMWVAWQIAVDLGVIVRDEYERLIAAQAKVIDRELAGTNCTLDARETLTDMRAEYRQLLVDC